MSASAACNHFSQLYRWKVQAVMKVHSRINDFSIIWLHTGLQEPEEQVQPTVMQTDSGVDGGN